MARTAIPDRVPLGTATTDHPFAFRGYLYRRITDTVTIGGARPLPIPASAEVIAANVARQNAWYAEQRAKADALKAAAIAVKDVERERKEADKAAKARHDEAIAYLASYTGTWPLALDIRADRRWGTKYMRLSDRQVDVLLEGKARDAARAEAAQIDRDLYAADQYEEHIRARSQTPQAAGLAPQPAARSTVAQVTEDGMYRTPDGVIWKVQRAVHGSGQLYAKRLDVEPGLTGTFVYEPGAIRRLRADQRMTLDEAKAFGKLYGCCASCGRTLTDEESIAEGIGPVCRDKF